MVLFFTPVVAPACALGSRAARRLLCGICWFSLNSFIQCHCFKLLGKHEQRMGGKEALQSPVKPFQAHSHHPKVKASPWGRRSLGSCSQCREDPAIPDPIPWALRWRAQTPMALHPFAIGAGEGRMLQRPKALTADQSGDRSKVLGPGALLTSSRMRFFARVMAELRALIQDSFSSGLTARKIRFGACKRGS